MNGGQDDQPRNETRVVRRLEGEPEQRYVYDAAAGPDSHHGQAHPSIFKTVHRLLRGRYAVTLSVAAVLGVAGAIGGYLSTKPKFRTTGQVQVESMLPTTGLGGPSLYSPLGNVSTYVATQAALMRSDRVIEAAMDSAEWRALGLGSSEMARRDYLASLEIRESPTSPELIEVSSIHEEKRFTQAVVKSLLKAYQTLHQEEEDRASDSQGRALRERRTQINAKINELNAQILDLSREFGTPDLQSALEQRTRQIDQLDEQIQRAKLREAELSSKVDVAIPKPSPQPQGPQTWSPEKIAQIDPRIVPLLDQLRQAEAEHKELTQVRRYGEQHPAVRASAARVSRAQAMVDDFVAKWQAPPQVQEAVAAMSSTDPEEIKTKRARWEELRAGMFAERAKMSEVQQRIGALRDQIRREEQELATVEQAISTLALQIRVVQEYNSTGRIRVRSEGFTPAFPSVDRRKSYAAAGLALGGGLPVALMMLLGLVDRRLRYSDDTGQDGIGAPLLGILPILPPDVKDEERRAMAAHCVHNIRVLLQLSAEAGGAKTYCVTSPTSGDGKTSLTLSLGLSFAASGARTVLVDFDTVGTGLSSSMDLRGGEGLVEAVLRGDLNGCVHPSGVDDRLFLIPSNPGDELHVSRFSTGAIRRLVRQLRDQFDVVLIDSGPILGSIEASLACAQADGVILVVGRGQQHTFVRRAVERIQAVGGVLAGIVFNRATAQDFKRSVSSGSMRSVPRGLPPGAGNVPRSGLAKAGPLARTVAEDVSDDRRAAS